MNFKRRQRKGYVGCCGMCACRKYAGGLPNKRMPSVQETRSTAMLPDDGTAEAPDHGEGMPPCPWCLGEECAFLGGIFCDARPDPLPGFTFADLMR